MKVVLAFLMCCSSLAFADNDVQYDPRNPQHQQACQKEVSAYTTLIDQCHALDRAQPPTYESVPSQRGANCLRERQKSVSAAKKTADSCCHRYYARSQEAIYQCAASLSDAKQSTPLSTCFEKRVPTACVSLLDESEHAAMDARYRRERGQPSK